MSGKDMLFLFAVMACVIVIGLFFLDSHLDSIREGLHM